MFNELLPDPACLFRFKFDLHRMASVGQAMDVQTWGFEDKHQIPLIEFIDRYCGSIKTKIGWMPQGLFFKFELDSLRKSLDRLPIHLYITLSVNSRYNSSILRENEFCSSFAFGRSKPVLFSRWNTDQYDLEPLTAFTKTHSDRKGSSVQAGSKSVIGWVRASHNSMTLWHQIGADMMPGYRPEEFPDIGLDFEIIIMDVERNLPADYWAMAHGIGSGNRNNPSLWTQCHLV